VPASGFDPASVFSRVLTTISRYNMLRPGDRVLAAVSGGADSVFLLHALAEIAPRVGAKLAGVAHLNHKLRGQASDQDEQFVAELAASRGVEFYRAEARVGEATGNLEQAARRARLSFFQTLIREGKADRVATGHTRDDQAETVLFRMLRGSGLAGLAGILPATKDNVIRPLLGTSRSGIEDFLRAQGIEWREDLSNRDPRFARNRIRHSLLPQLEREWNPVVREALARMADLASAEEHWWSAKIDRLVRKAAVERDGAIEICANSIAALPKAVSRRLARELIRRAGGRSAEFEHVEKTIALARGERGSGRLELPALAVVRSFERLRFVPAGIQVSAPETIRVELGPGFLGRYPWDGGAVCFEVVGKPVAGKKSGKPGCVRLKWRGQSTSALVELRGWRDGDHYRPRGSSRDQKVKEMFQKARIPSWKRIFWPIVTSGSKILWAREFGAATGAAGRRERGGWLRVWEEASDSDGKDAGR
jgi:tRNA(Ile)-lysidine synthase